MGSRTWNGGEEIGNNHPLTSGYLVLHFKPSHSLQWLWMTDEYLSSADGLQMDIRFVACSSPSCLLPTPEVVGCQVTQTGCWCCQLNPAISWTYLCGKVWTGITSALGIHCFYTVYMVQASNGGDNVRVLFLRGRISSTQIPVNASFLEWF